MLYIRNSITRDYLQKIALTKEAASNKFHNHNIVTNKRNGRSKSFKDLKEIKKFINNLAQECAISIGSEDCIFKYFNTCQLVDITDGKRNSVEFSLGDYFQLILECRYMFLARRRSLCGYDLSRLYRNIKHRNKTKYTKIIAFNDLHYNGVEVEIQKIKSMKIPCYSLRRCVAFPEEYLDLIRLTVNNDLEYEIIDVDDRKKLLGQYDQLIPKR